MFLFRSNVRHRLGMMLRTYRETKLYMCSTKVVTSVELQNTPMG